MKINFQKVLEMKKNIIFVQPREKLINYEKKET